MTTEGLGGAGAGILAGVGRAVSNQVPLGGSLFKQKAKTGGAVERLTDTSKYTGSHKERFDESGKGKGIAGRQDILDDSGYVSAYKNAGTYDAKVKK